MTKLPLWLTDDDENPPTEEIHITAASLAGMAASNPNPDPKVHELDGPKQAYFEIPLDWFVSQDARIEPPGTEGTVRMIQRVHYKSFKLIGTDPEQVYERGLMVIAAVRAELKRACEVSFIWWRLRPTYALETLTDEDIAKGRAARHGVRLRLGTSPTLPPAFWMQLSRLSKNVSSEPLVLP